jgi:D-arabinose 1-dehydrogenase-like Zn-dependent alcohol dehydrogenase
MRAAILTGYNEPMVVEEVAAAAMGPRDVLVHIDASGVCHSDLSMANGNEPRGQGRPCDRILRPRVRQLLLLPA